jgi:hypothetical protein
MDDPERTHFVDIIHSLERSRSRWRLAALAALAGLALTFLFLGAMNVVQEYRAAVSLQRARAVEAEAREATEVQRQQAETAKRQADEARAAKERK